MASFLTTRDTRPPREWNRHQPIHRETQNHQRPVTTTETTGKFLSHLVNNTDTWGRKTRLTSHRLIRTFVPILLRWKWWCSGPVRQLSQSEGP